MGETISIRSLSVLAHRFIGPRRLSWVPDQVMGERPTNTTKKGRHKEEAKRPPERTRTLQAVDMLGMGLGWVHACLAAPFR